MTNSQPELPRSFYNKLPQEINAGWATFKVEQKTGLKAVDGHDAWASIDFDHHVIHVDPLTPSESLSRINFLHELIHLMLQTHGLGHDKIVTSNEDLTLTLEKGLMQLSLLNPGLMGLIFEHGTNS